VSFLHIFRVSTILDIRFIFTNVFLGFQRPPGLIPEITFGNIPWILSSWFVKIFPYYSIKKLILIVKILRMIVDAPWYVPNSLIRSDLSCPTVKEEIRRYSSHYGARLCTHPNNLAVNPLRLPDNRRRRRYLSKDPVVLHLSWLFFSFHYLTMVSVSRLYRR
jgi:hypothetical protein